MLEVRFSPAVYARIKNDISEKEINEGLEELGYQTRYHSGATPKQKWILTSKGWNHGRMSRNPFRKVILWDLNAYLKVRIHILKKARKYPDCKNCQAYLNFQKE